MIIRATKKVLDVNKLKAGKHDVELSAPWPGEWFVDLVSAGKPGKMALQFIHNPTRMVVLVTGKSLAKAYPILQERAAAFLTRHGYQMLIPLFKLEGTPIFYTTNSRSVMAYSREVKWSVEHNFRRMIQESSIDIDFIEDLFVRFPFTSKDTGKKFTNVKEVLDKQKEMMFN